MSEPSRHEANRTIQQTQLAVQPKANTVSDTPRKDAFLKEHGMPNCDGDGVAVDLIDALEHELAAMTKERDKKHELLCFVERWATHHGSKPHMTAGQTLDVIRHHPDIDGITKSYSDGVIPPTPNLWEENNALRSRVAELEAQLEEYAGWSKWKAGLWLIEHGEASHEATYIGEKK